MKVPGRQQHYEKLQHQYGGLYEMKGKGQARKVSVCTTLALLILVAGVSVILGLLVGVNFLSYDGTRGSQAVYSWGETVVVDGMTQSVTSYLANKLKADDMRKNLQTLTEFPHIAGSERNRDLAQLMLYSQWLEYDFDSVEVLNYSVLLSFPNSSLPNSLTLKQANTSKVIYSSHIHQEPPLTPGEDSPDVVPPFNAYSGSGKVSGPLVYVNYGRQNDFRYLTRHLGLNITDYICIVRYGMIFRGDKAALAQDFGCKGLLIFSDPHDYAPEGVPVYPDGPSLPKYGVQRGSLSRTPGDLLTPDVPAIDGMYRRHYSAAEAEGTVPRIPVQPISYGDAVHFMEQLTDMTTPDDWVGGLDVKYRIRQSKQNTNYTELVVNNYQEQKTIYNVVAKIYGAIEPDRQVILGNHRDAWVFGAVDPNSGTAALMSIANALGDLRKTNWRPGRTITLCSWDAEEYGLIGSTEWVEDFGKLLEVSTVAYLNVDSAVTGTESLSVSASPLLYQVFWGAAGMVSCPNNSFNTVYDEWLNATSAMYKGVPQPMISDLGSGTDFTAFYHLRGITSSSMSYVNISHMYAVYHSVHDNFNWMSKYGDQDFTRHQATATVWATAALMLTTTPLPLMDVSYFSDWAEQAAETFSKKHSIILREKNITLTNMLSEIHSFASVCANFSEDVNLIRKDQDISQKLSTVRIIMDKIMNLERAFILPEGLPGRQLFKHMMVAPDVINTYDSTLLPGLDEAIRNATEFGGSWDAVRKQRDLLTTHFRYASQILNDPTLNFTPDYGY